MRRQQRFNINIMGFFLVILIGFVGLSIVNGLVTNKIKDTQNIIFNGMKGWLDMKIEINLNDSELNNMTTGDIKKWVNDNTNNIVTEIKNYRDNTTGINMDIYNIMCNYDCPYWKAEEIYNNYYKEG